MPVLADTAQIIMNLYYQQYKSDEDFFKLFHFKYLAGSVVSKIMEDDYTKAKAESRSIDPYAEVDLPAEWLIPEENEVKKDGSDNIIKLKHQPFSFPYDLLGRTVQRIENLSPGSTCTEWIRISIKEKWKFHYVPKGSKVFFAVIKDKIEVFADCKIGKVRVYYCPELTDPSFGEDGGIVPASKEADVISKTLTLMMAARQGTVVDTTNNSNPNKTIQTEIDTVFSNLRTKPI